MNRLASRARRLLAGPVGRILLPAVVLQSVLVGGGYATGREIVAYGGKFGPLGALSIVVIFVGFSLVSVATFEVARVFRAYEYKRFVRQIIGRAWPLFDLLYAAMAVLVIAIMASAAAEIMDQTLGIAQLWGTAIVVLGVAGLSYAGGGAIEAFKGIGTVFLYGAFVLLAASVLAGRWDAVAATFGGGGASYLPEAGVGSALGAGALYVGYNLAVYPAVLFTLHRQRSRRDSLVSGVLAGLLMTLPFALTYLCIMAFYPDPRVMDAPVPWLPMLSAAGGGTLVAIYGVVMGWTLLETSIGMIHALLERADADLSKGERRGLSPLQRGLLGAGVLVAAALLSRVGIVALVARGYSFMAYGFIALFAVPLLTVGIYRATRERRRGG